MYELPLQKFTLIISKQANIFYNIPNLKPLNIPINGEAP